MNPSFIDILFHWLDNTPVLLQRACVVVVITYVAIRLTWFRRALRGAARQWRSCVITAVFFGVLAMVGTHLGIVVDADGVASDNITHLPTKLQHYQAIISFRDMMAISAGLVAGPWVGLGAGLIAGMERYWLGSFVGLASGLATIILGLGAGLIRQTWPKALHPAGTITIVLIGSALQKVLVIALSEPRNLAYATLLETVIPETTVNCLGCLLFLSVMKDLEREQWVAQAQQAELRALRAQIEPHFINNVLNGINSLINGEHPAHASAFVIKLARFLDQTRETAKANAITLHEELSRTENYLELQQLRFPSAFHVQYNVPEELRNCFVPPYCLLTPVINAFLHGRRGQSGCFNIDIFATDQGNSMVLEIIDRGIGITSERLKWLGKQPVDSDRGSGNGLYQLNESLKLAFDGMAKMTITSQTDIGTTVTLLIPKRHKPW